MKPHQASLGSLLLCAAAAAQAALPPPANFTGASWIWHDEPSAQGVEMPGGEIVLQAQFDLPEDFSGVEAYISASIDNAGVVFLNGEEVLQTDNWQVQRVVPVGQLLRPQENTVRVEAMNEGPNLNPAGVLLRLWTEDGETLVASGPGWASEGDGEWGAARVLAPVGMGPWGKVGDDTMEKLAEVPEWNVPGHEQDLESLRELFSLHYKPKPHVPFYDPWVTLGGAWVETNDGISEAFRGQLRASYEGMRIDEEGYVSTQQHRGAGHPDGWPFPTWTQSGGWGWQWARHNMPYGPELGIHEQRTLDGFELNAASEAGYDDFRGLVLELEPGASLTTPEFEINSLVSPFFRIDWTGEPIPGAKPSIQWREKGQAEFSAENTAPFDWIDPDRGGGLYFTVADMQETARREIPIVQFRINFGNRAPAEIGLQAIMTAVDSRHNNNNLNFIRGAVRYANWTGERDFVEEQLPRMRRALRYAMDEFNTRESLCIDTAWIGHDGRSGIAYVEGEKQHYPGVGIGNNYWDLLPFGGKDLFATIYLYDALMHLADLEERVARDPALAALASGTEMSPADLRAHAREIKEHAGREFWNPETQRFTAGLAVDGTRADYGFTFMNTEAVYFDFATPEQAKAIFDWLSGDRIVEGDTSTGDDIYHWRFGPRSTTKRNIEYYAYIWPGPETIPWGGQVQDGGAVLGFTHFDVGSRVKVRGADDAWGRLQEITQWHRDVQAEGGVRPYYSVEGRGTLQGGGTAGGLGIDFEFFESIMTPASLVYGFAGLKPRYDELEFNPQLPSDWPSFELPDIAYQGRVLKFDIAQNEATVQVTAGEGLPRRLTPKGDWELADGESGVFASAGDTVRVVRSERR